MFVFTATCFPITDSSILIVPPNKYVLSFPSYADTPNALLGIVIVLLVIVSNPLSFTLFAIIVPVPAISNFPLYSFHVVPLSTLYKFVIPLLSSNSILVSPSYFTPYSVNIGYP